MSNFVQVGTYATPLEACEAVGVRYREAFRAHGFSYLCLYRGGKTDGRIKPFDDGRGGMVFNQREKTMAIWSDVFQKGEKLTKQQRLEFERKAAKCRAKFEAEERAKNEVASRYAALLYRTAKPCRSHLYLSKKHVPMVDTLRVISYEEALAILKAYYAEVGKPEPFSIPSRKGRGLLAGSPLLVVPMRGENKDFQAVQLIDIDGGKSFLWGCRKSGAYWQTESLPEFDPSDSISIGIAEGVATALSVAYVKKIPVISAMDCGNLPSVALQIRRRFPKAKILILSDVGNGEKEAQKATQIVNGFFAIPKFSDELKLRFEHLTGKQVPTDFNDYYLARGLLL